MSQMEPTFFSFHFAAKECITLNAFIILLFVQLENLGIILDSFLSHSPQSSQSRRLVDPTFFTYWVWCSPIPTAIDLIQAPTIF